MRLRKNGEAARSSATCPLWRRAAFSVPANKVGRKIQCPKCKGTFRVKGSPSLRRRDGDGRCPAWTQAHAGATIG